MEQPSPTGRSEFREIRRSLVDARDEQIARVLALVDSMPQRGEADALIAPLRPRLAQLRLGRRMNFVRLLFTPLDPLIVPGSKWRNGDLSLPRPILAPLATVVRAAISTDAARIETTLEAEQGSERVLDRAEELGTTLWPRAAGVLTAANCPADWRETSGLPRAEYPALVAVVVALLRQAPRLTALQVDIAKGTACPDEVFRRIISDTLATSPQALPSLLALLIARFPHSARLLTLAANNAGGAALRSSVEPAIEYTLQTLETALQSQGETPTPTAAEAAADAHRLATMLDELENTIPQSPERKRRIEQVRRRADSIARDRFERMLRGAVLGPLSGQAQEPTDDETAAVEDSARALRRLDLVARRLGGNEIYDAMLQAGAQRVALATTAPLMDRVRLTEILVGTDAALALLDQGR